MRGGTFAGLVLGLVSVLAMPASAQNWPQRTVRFVLPLGPGSGADIADHRRIGDRHRVHDLIGPLPEIAIGRVEQPQIRRRKKAAGMATLLLILCVRTCDQHRAGDDRQRGARQ